MISLHTKKKTKHFLTSSHIFLLNFFAFNSRTIQHIIHRIQKLYRTRHVYDFGTNEVNNGGLDVIKKNYMTEEEANRSI